MTKNTPYQDFLQGLQTGTGTSLNLRSVEDINLGVTKVTWGMALQPYAENETEVEYSKIDSYFDNETGEHISTHMAGQVYNETINQVIIFLLQILKQINDGALPASEFDSYLA